MDEVKCGKCGAPIPTFVDVDGERMPKLNKHKYNGTPNGVRRTVTRVQREVHYVTYETQQVSADGEWYDIERRSADTPGATESPDVEVNDDCVDSDCVTSWIENDTEASDQWTSYAEPIDPDKADELTAEMNKPKPDSQSSGT